MALIGQAVILVGGLGTRLGALTAETPKPLLDVGGRPFLTYLLDELARHHVGEVVLLAGYRGEKIEAVASGRPNVRVVVEPEPRGTGGALRFARDHLDDQFFLLNGDSLFDINLWDLAEVAGDGCALALREIADVSRYGSAELQGDRITRFDAEPGAAGAAGATGATGAVRPGLINGGVAVLTRDLLDRIAPDRPVSIERDVYPALAQAGALHGRIYNRPFLDIGTPQDFARAQAWVPRTLSRGAVVFDRDGVLNEEVNYAYRPDQIAWVEGATEAVKAVNDAGLFAFVATNQAGIGRGYYTEADVQALHLWMNAELMAHGAHIDAFAYSPFHPEAEVEAYRRDTLCRKPGPGMLTDLFARFPVDLSRTVMIGDRLSDVACAEAAGVRGLLFEGGDLMAALAPEIAQIA